MQTPDNDTKTIAALNDRFRNTYWGGTVTMTPGVSEMPEDARCKLFNAVMHYDAFTPDNDPHGEHDFGKVVIDASDYFWKIDYYDPTMTYGSENPADPKVTTRVLTIMHASEY